MRMLVVSDKEFWVRSLDSTLGACGFSVLGVSTGKAAVERIAEIRPDFLIIQSELRDTSGYDLCSSLRISGAIDPATPVLIITSGPCNREERVAALRAGAWECYSFPPDPELLVLKLHNYANAKRSGAPLLEENEIDDASGLYGPEGTLRRAAELVLFARRNGRALACAVLSPAADVSPSSAAATLAGPAIIRRIAQVLRSVGRHSDVIGRLTETQFVVFAPETDGDGIVALAQRLIQEVEAIGGAGTLDGLPVRLQAGCFGLANLAESDVDAVGMATRATLALAARSGEGVVDVEPPLTSPEIS